MAWRAVAGEGKAAGAASVQEEAVVLYMDERTAAAATVTSLQEETVVTVSLQERTEAACLQKATMDAGAGGGGREYRSRQRWSWMQEPAAVVMMWVAGLGSRGDIRTAAMRGGP